MADNLESYFKKHLSDDTPARDKWNVPSDDVWNKVLPEIQKKKGLFIPWTYLYFTGGALLAIFLIILLWPPTSEKNNNTETISKNIAQNSTTITNESGETSKSSSNKIVIPDEHNQNSNKQIIEQEEKANNKTPLLEKGISGKSTSANKLADQDFAQNKSGKLKSTEPLSVKYSSDNTISGPSNRNKQLTEAAFLADKYSNQYPQISLLSKRSIDGLSSDINMHIIIQTSPSHTAPTNEIVEKQEPYNNKGKVGLGVFFAPTFTSTYLKGDMNSGKIETSNMLLYSNGWGFELRYYLSNRFNLVAGVESSEIKSWSKSLVDFDYDKSTEHDMESGEKENTSPVPMPTPFGNIDTEITYRFPGEEPIPDGEIMQSELETHQEVSYWSVPVGVEFNIIPFSRFNWFAETGLRYNRAIKDAASFSSRILHEGHDMDVVGEEMTSHPSYTENYLNLYLGTGVNYQFSKNIQVSGSIRYFNSITRVNYQDNLSTHVRGFNFKIGIAYLF